MGANVYAETELQIPFGKLRAGSPVGRDDNLVRRDRLGELRRHGS
jgi:hypothetical protein